MEKSNVPYDTISRLSVTSQSMFNKCCCCIPLRVGCFILGYLNLVINVFQFLFFIAVTAFVGFQSHGFKHLDKEDATDDEDMQPFLEALGFLLIIVLIADLVWLIVNIACLVGLHNKNPGPVRVYVGFATTRLVLILAAFIRNLSRDQENDANTIILRSLNLGLSAYFIFVYYIYARQLQKEREEERRQPAPANVYIYPKLDQKYLVA